MNGPLLEINNLGVEYRTQLETVYAVNGVNLSLNRGETLGLVGETGAGKTTIALSIIQLLPEKVGVISQGEIVFDGIELHKEKEIQSIRGNRISMVFQDPMTSLNPVMTVGEQIAEAIKYHDNSSGLEIAERVDAMLEKVGIPAGRKNEYPHQFSGGMKQRVLIAMALACNPELLIADEPTSALDVTIQAQILRMIAELKEEFQTSIILITHDLAVISEICDKVAVIYSGEVVESGTVKDFFGKTYHHPYTEGLFHSIPVLDKKTKRLSPIEGTMPDPTKKIEGCKFYSRCKYRCDQCRSKVNLVEAGKDHMIKCQRFVEKSK